jgi:hypothetical protein
MHSVMADLPNWLDLPKEIVQTIFQMLDSVDILSATRMSPKWVEIGRIVLIEEHKV